ncbi:5' exonuclease Apollo-like [Limulus polyphemus]|uniref:5' exonuclease Apollo n=1 Tax=Limulus polyphemus TaxID=6850 RepID=A0ABM1SHT5_LIMPO|nr:5' exonuclease Apollo-like [Limulus polyphemus]
MGGSRNGHIITGTPIAVDFWKISECSFVKLFFLTHLHADHIMGLSKSWCFPIYTSPVNASLLPLKVTGLDPTLVKPLQLYEEHLIPVCKSQTSSTTVTVTLFEANHCPGAVMFLFQGEFGNVLYTGDFRYKPEILNVKLLPTIDILYLDNTYCSPECMFETQEEATRTVVEKVKELLEENRKILIGIDSLGKENLLLSIFEETGCEISVTEERMKTLKTLDISHIATHLDSKIMAVPTQIINAKTMMHWNKVCPTSAILPTARFVGCGSDPYVNYKDIYVVPYSDHSSFSELRLFVDLVHPHSVVPIVPKDAKGVFGRDISDRADMSVFCALLRKERTDAEEYWKDSEDNFSVDGSGDCIGPDFRLKIQQKTATNASLTTTNEVEVKSDCERTSESVHSCSSDEEDTVWEVLRLNGTSPIPEVRYFTRNPFGIRFKKK